MSKTAVRDHEDFGPAIVQGRSLRRRLEAGEILLEAAEATPGGIVTANRVRKPAGCLLDDLLAKGQLGKGDDAKRRHEAGLWLRTLYHEKALLGPRAVMRYGTGSGGKGEIDEAVAWNRKVYNDTFRALPPFWKILEGVCCHDHGPIIGIIHALDALADHRGM